MSNFQEALIEAIITNIGAKLSTFLRGAQYLIDPINE